MGIDGGGGGNKKVSCSDSDSGQFCNELRDLEIVFSIS